MKRVVVAISAVVMSIGLLLAGQSAHASTNDFTISNYKIDYTLSKDADNRSVLKTVETITAQFSDFDQNHGIERAIPTSYDSHSVSLVINSVTDQSGSSLPYSTYTSNGNEVVRIGEKNTYVHGEKTYIITYTQRDATKFFANTNDDEFYWDTNGTEWAVPINALTVTLHLDESLKSALNGKVACYQGASGASAACSLLQVDPTTYSVSALDLAAHENVTIAVGFQPHTFATYQMTLGDKILAVFGLIWLAVLPISIGVVIWLAVRWKRWSNRTKEVGTIIPEYIPPADASVTTSASIIGSGTKTFAAQLVDFAVRHYIKIYEIEKKWIFGSRDYEIEIIRDITDLRPEEQEVLRDIFSGDTAIGQRLAMSSLKNNNSVYMSTLDNDKKLKDLIRGTYGLRTKDADKSAWFKRTGWILCILGIVFLNPFFFFGGFGAIIAGIVLYPFTDKGLDLYRYLEGLKMYIGVAEVDRLKMLQSPEGAEKVGALDPNDPKQMVKLYERVLPYAILFGQETEWNKRLGAYYESLGAQPDWYSSNGVFTMIAFSSAMDAFSTTSSYTAASSSSSGGSSGGGFSGGGGGGGGGGGW